MQEKQWYKNIVENNSEAPPENVWDGIQDELDIDGVWGRIESDFNAEQKKKRFFYIRIAASVLLLVIAGGGLLLFLSDMLKTSDQIADRVETDRAVSYEITDHSEVGSPDDALEPGIEISIPEHGMGVSKIESRQDTELLAYEEQAADKPELKPEDTGISQEGYFADVSDTRSSHPAFMVAKKEELFTPDFNVRKIADRQLTGFREMISEDQPDIRFEQDKEHQRGNVSFAYVGITGQLANTWMLNEKTFEAFRRDEFTATEPSFGSNLGLRAGVSVTPHLNLLAEFMLHSRTNQHYREYIHGRYVQNSFTLDYYLVSMFANFSPIKRSPEHRLLAGGYGGLMKGAVQNIDGYTRETTADYHRTDYGLLFGYEYRFGLRHGLTFSPGIFVKAGLNNIFSGNDRIPYYLNRTRNASFNLSFSIEYHIPQN